MNSIKIMTKKQAIDVEAIKAFLTAEPDFFQAHPDMLEHLSFSHPAMGAVSLLEYQTRRLRHQLQERTDQLNTLVENARINDALFEKTQKLILDLATVTSLNEIAGHISHHFGNHFNTDISLLTLFNDACDSSSECVQYTTLKHAKHQVDFLFTHPRPTTRYLTPKEKTFLFPQEYDMVQSSAVAPILLAGDVIGILALGSYRDDYFNETSDTLFLSFIADFLGRRLSKFVEKRDKTLRTQDLF